MGRRGRGGPLTVAAVALAAYSVWTGAWLVRHGGPMAFVHVGRTFALQSPDGAAIRAAASAPGATDTGYDGQFAYYMAVDPADAWRHMDAPAYRWSRVGMPLLAWLLALGRTALVPWTMLALGLAGMGLGVASLAVWLSARGTNPWWALVYGFHPGVFSAVQLDTTEALAYGLAAAGMLLLWRRDRGQDARDARDRRDASEAPVSGSGPGRVAAAAALLGLAGLTRETVLVFPIVCAVAWGLGRTGPAGGTGERRRRPLGQAMLLLALGVLPALAWRWLVYARLGSGGLQPAVAVLPLQGLLSFWPLEPREWIEVVAIALPGVLLLGLALAALLWRRGHRDQASPAAGGGDVELALLALNVLLLVLFLQRSSWFSYFDPARVGVGVVLAAVLALPALRARLPRTTRRLWPAVVVLWFSAVPPGLLLPHTFHAFKL